MLPLPIATRNSSGLFLLKLFAKLVISVFEISSFLPVTLCNIFNPRAVNSSFSCFLKNLLIDDYAFAVVTIFSQVSDGDGFFDVSISISSPF